MIAMLLAGGQGSRLYVLTQKLAKPAVPFGGKYRIIDFPLSNCVNSGIDTVGILTQYQPLVLNEYIGNGQPWDLDRLHGGVHVLPPYQQASGSDWYKGTANAIYQNLGFIESYDPEYVIILSGDQICKQDYRDFLRFHKQKNAEFSVAVMEVPWEETHRFGLAVTRDDDSIIEFQEKPKDPKSNLASMGIYIFNWDVLKKYLIEDEADPESENDFGNNIIPNLLKDGRVVSKETMGELLRDTIKANNIHCTLGAVSLANESVFIRSVTMPVMTISQLASNLPRDLKLKRKRKRGAGRRALTRRKRRRQLRLSRQVTRCLKTGQLRTGRPRAMRTIWENLWSCLPLPVRNPL